MSATTFPTEAVEVTENKPSDKAVKMPGNRKEKLQMMNALKMNVNFKLMTLDKTSEKHDEEQIELLSQLKGIELQILMIKMNKNESKFFVFTPSGVLNRKQRREA